MEEEIRHWLSSPATQVAQGTAHWALQAHCLVTKIVVVGATTYSAAVGGDIPYSSGNRAPGWAPLG